MIKAETQEKILHFGFFVLLENTFPIEESGVTRR